MTIPTLVLPGMDGTTRLLSRFRELAPPAYDVSLLSLPNDEPLTYDQLAEHFDSVVGSSENCLLLGESFSGPLAVQLALRHPDTVTHVVLVASFITSPVPSCFGVLPWGLLFRCPLPRLVVRLLLVGINSDPRLAAQVRRTVQQVPPRVLAARMRQMLTVAVTGQLQSLGCAVSYLRPTRDAVVSRTALDRILAARPDTSVAEIDGPHLILRTHPVEAWHEIVKLTGQ